MNNCVDCKQQIEQQRLRCVECARLQPWQSEEFTLEVPEWTMRNAKKSARPAQQKHMRNRDGDISLMWNQPK